MSTTIRLGWRTAFTFLPDLTITVAGLSGLALAAGITRLTRIGRRIARPATT